MGWMENIAALDSREEARQKFHEWCEMKAFVHDDIEFVGRQNDVARLHIYGTDNYFARNIAQNYQNNPVRVIDINPVDGSIVEVEILLADLTTADLHI